MESSKQNLPETVLKSPLANQVGPQQVSKVFQNIAHMSNLFCFELNDVFAIALSSFQNVIVTVCQSTKLVV